MFLLRTELVDPNHRCTPYKDRLELAEEQNTFLSELLDPEKNKVIWFDTHVVQLPYRRWYQAEILLTSSKDPEVLAERDLHLQDDGYGSQASFYNWKINSQNADLCDFLQRFEFFYT